jgi:RNA polymerase sigma-70 factor (ECF subfamily)
MSFASIIAPLWIEQDIARYECPSFKGRSRGEVVSSRADDERPEPGRAKLDVSARSAALDARMEAVLSGDARAFEGLYRALAPRVRGFLRGLCGDERTAEDLTQTTFLKIHRARSTYQRGAPVEPWVFAIARRTWLDHRRSRRRHPEDLSADGVVPEPASRDEAAEGFDRLDPAVADALQAGLAALPEAQREAVLLLKAEGLSVADAAQIVGVTPGALKVRAHRGYEALRKAIGLRRQT